MMNFTQNMGTETAALGWALLTGAALGVYYDLFRILRRIFRFGYAMILVQDMLFWTTGAVAVFFACVVVYSGRLRIIFVLVTLIGWWIYTATVGAVMMMIVDRTAGILRAVCLNFYRRFVKPAEKQVRNSVVKLFDCTKSKMAKKKQLLRKKKKNTA